MNEQALIAIVDDDDHIRTLLQAYLHKENFRTIGLSTAEDAWVLAQTNPPALWILDIMLPGMDGYELCRRIREKGEVPIVMISAKDDEVDKILGLELGSDDYMVKPFSPRELVARVKRQLERWMKVNGGDRRFTESNGDELIAVGALQLNVLERRIFWQHAEIDLTSKEYEMVKVLASHPNRAFTRDELLTHVWGDDYFGSDRAVDHLIKRIRKKIDLPIEAVWGHGYRMRIEKGDA
ncbi:response regulator transcription factor [Paenibacillus sp. GCM10027626]|uniref:response regulator transcription factor n=1 Tax=Paenibacillus sp. GCM10027626 TaxID=3273411 RepID=UPI00363C57B9